MLNPAMAQYALVGVFNSELVRGAPPTNTVNTTIDGTSYQSFEATQNPLKKHGATLVSQPFEIPCYSNFVFVMSSGAI
jgi:hypothetical protein